MEPQQVRCSHILQKHNKSRNPKDSYRQKPVTRSEEEAIANIKQILEQVKKAANPQEEFGKIAKQLSECTSAGKNGDLGFFGHGDMQEAFEKTSFKLKVGEISDPIKTDSGWHIILRTG